MKKKLLLALVLASILTAGTAFASPVHPGGLGIGALWGGSFDNGIISNAALSLKLPVSPIFWGVRFGLGGDNFWMGLQGDSYLIGTPLTKSLSWFLGVGAYVNAWFGDVAGIGFGLRVPFGLTWQPVRFFEAFMNIAPQLGAYVQTGGNNGGFFFPRGGFFSYEVGLRLWI
jgi:hypothetical protein